MNALNELINVSDFIKASGIIFAGTVIYSIVHMLYDMITKSDIEKCLTYRGRDRIISGIFIFFIYVLATIISAYKELTGVNKDVEIFFSIIVIVAVSVVASLVTFLILFLVHVLFEWKRINPRYEVKIDANKEEYWRIDKVTKSNSVILRNGDMYLFLANTNELSGKKILKQKRGKK